MQKLGCFFKTVFFLEFRSNEAVFGSIEIGSKFLRKNTVFEKNKDTLF